MRKIKENSKSLINQWARLFEEKDQEFEKDYDDLSRLGLVRVEHIPEYAISYMVYGDSSGLDKEDIRIIDGWMKENGYGDLVELEDDSENEFDRYPAFGKPCKTYTAIMSLKDGPAPLQEKEEEVEVKADVEDEVDDGSEDDSEEHDEKKSDEMTLDDAIDHLKDLLSDKDHEWPCEECKHEHEQLLGWLEELKSVKNEKEETEEVTDESKNACKTESKKCLKESNVIGLDVIDDLAERAQIIIDDENKSATEAVKEAIDDGLIYTDDVIALLKHYQTIKDGEIIDSYYDRLFDDVMNLVKEHEDEDDRPSKTFVFIKDGETEAEAYGIEVPDDVTDEELREILDDNVYDVPSQISGDYDFGQKRYDIIDKQTKKPFGALVLQTFKESKKPCKTESKKFLKESKKNYLRLDKRKDDGGDYIVKVYEDGKYNEDASYFTDDWEDAVGTFKDLAKRFKYEIIKDSPRGYIAEKL